MCNSTTSRLVRPPVHLILNSLEKFLFFAQGEPSNSSESFRFVRVPLAGVSLLDKIDFSSIWGYVFIIDLEKTYCAKVLY